MSVEVSTLSGPVARRTRNRRGEGGRLRAEIVEAAVRLLARCAAYVTFARERPQRHALFDAVSHGTLAPDEAGDAFRVFVSGVSDCVAAGRSRSIDPFADATAVWVAVHGYGTLRARHPDFPWPQDEHSWTRDTVRRLARISPEDEDAV